MERSQFLRALSGDVRRRLMARGSRRVFTDGTVIFHRDMPGDAMLVIETGRVEITNVASNGRRILLGQLGSGDLVGELSLLDGSPRSADVTAAGPVTGLMLGFVDVKAVLLEHPEAMLSVLIDLARKLRAANALTENRSLDDGAARLARCLMDLAQRWGEPHGEGGTRIRERFSQTTLGQMASLSRENVNRRLRAWTREGWLAAEGGRLVLVSPDVIRRIAESCAETEKT
ncbi:MAG: Crp/Fnr family transcriptional regulator [Pseudomonadota bacterium]